MSGLSSFNCKLVSAGIDAMLFCPICKELLNRPVSTECGHSACKACMELHLKSPFKSNCPHCRQKITASSLSINFAASIAVSQFEVGCTNIGCDWRGKHGEMESHWQTCPKMELHCVNHCGNPKYRREHETIHLASCQYQPIPCKFCHVLVPRFNLGAHKANCQDRPRPCPLGCKEKTLPRSHVPLHLFKCEERVVKCEVKGCNVYYKQRERYGHFRQYEQSHQESLMTEVESLKGCFFAKAGVEVERQIAQIRAFKWNVGDVQMENPKTLACPMFGFDRNQFVCRWDQGSHKIYICKVTGSTPITLQVRYAFVASGRVIDIFSLPSPVTLNEETEAALAVSPKFQGRHQDVVVKIFITVFRHE